MMEVLEGELKEARAKREDVGEEVDGGYGGVLGEGEDLAKEVEVGLFDEGGVGGSEGDAASEGDCRIEESLEEGSMLRGRKFPDVLLLSVDPMSGGVPLRREANEVLEEGGGGCFVAEDHSDVLVGGSEGDVVSVESEGERGVCEGGFVLSKDDDLGLRGICDEGVGVGEESELVEELLEALSRAGEEEDVVGVLDFGDGSGVEGEVVGMVGRFEVGEEKDEEEGGERIALHDSVSRFEPFRHSSSSLHPH